MCFQLKRASSDDALTKPAQGAAASGSRMKKTVTTGAISDLAEARPRSLSGKMLSPLLLQKDQKGDLNKLGGAASLW